MPPNPTSADLAVMEARLAANRGQPQEKRDRSRDAEQEAKLQAEIESWLTRERIWFHHDRDRRGDKAGVPDLLICFCGEFVAVELKSKTGKLRPEQLGCMAEIRKSGGRTFVARSLHEFASKIGAVNEKEPR